MEILDILKGASKFGGLSLLAFSLNSCSPQGGVVEGYMNAIVKEDVEKVREYCTKKRGRYVNGLSVKMLKNLYEDYKLHDYIDMEGNIDRDDVWWIERRDGMYNRISLVIEDNQWKISDVSSPINP